MTLKIIDNNNPVILLKPYEIKEKVIRNAKKSEKTTLPEETLNIWLLHLNTIFKDSSENLFLKDIQTFIGSTSTSEIIHSAVGLFDTCLPDMDLDTIYGSIVNKEAFTILAFSNQANAKLRLKRNIGKIKNKTEKIESVKKLLDKDKFKQTENSEENEDVYSTGEEKEDEFQLIFNDDSGEESEEENTGDSSSDDESNDDFSLGYNQYIKRIYQRKLRCLTENVENITEIGFENQIVGALSFKLRYVDVRKVVHVTMLGVLKEYRSRGVGKYLINLVLDPKLVGQYDAVVVHADFSACEFFKKYGFSDDTLLNTQWHSLEPEYTNCSLLTYVPAYSSKVRDNRLLAEEFSTAEMEVDLKLWQKKVTEVHCFQFQVFQKMKMEIEHLKETIKNQDKIMKTIMKELRESNKEKVRLERFLKTNSKYQENSTEIIAPEAGSKSDDDALENVESKVTAHFHESLKMVGQFEFVKFLDFISADPPSLLLAEHKAIKRSLNAFSPRLSSKSMVSSRILYFCEPCSLTKESKQKILAEGFDKSHRKPGSHGLGYYFASNPSTAAIYASNNNIVAVEVILGNVFRNISEIQPLKESAPDGYESVLVASSFMNQTNNNAHSANDISYFYSQEFVIFDPAQALPLGLVNFFLVEVQ